jgi:hypothetical protein
MRQGLLGVIEAYDLKQRAYIAGLEEENERLREKVAELTNLAVAGAMASDRMKLELILTGALKRPTCIDIVDDAPCGKIATRYHPESMTPFCDDHGGKNPRYQDRNGQ